MVYLECCASSGLPSRKQILAYWGESSKGTGMSFVGGEAEMAGLLKLGERPQVGF